MSSRAAASSKEQQFFKLAAAATDAADAQVTWYVEKKWVDINVTDKLGCNAAHYAVARQRHSLLVWLVNHGIDINHKNHNGRTPLHTAAEKGSPEMIKEVLDNGAESLDAPDNDGNTPLHIAAIYCEASAVSCLLSCGANAIARNLQGQTPAMAAGHGCRNLHSLGKVRLLLSQHGGVLDSLDDVSDQSTPHSSLPSTTSGSISGGIPSVSDGSSLQLQRSFSGDIMSTQDRIDTWHQGGGSQSEKENMMLASKLARKLPVMLDEVRQYQPHVPHLKPKLEMLDSLLNSLHTAMLRANPRGEMAPYLRPVLKTLADLFNLVQTATKPKTSLKARLKQSLGSGLDPKVAAGLKALDEELQQSCAHITQQILALTPEQDPDPMFLMSTVSTDLDTSTFTSTSASSSSVTRPTTPLNHPTPLSALLPHPRQHSTRTEAHSPAMPALLPRTNSFPASTTALKPFASSSGSAPPPTSANAHSLQLPTHPHPIRRASPSPQPYVGPPAAPSTGARLRYASPSPALRSSAPLHSSSQPTLRHPSPSPSLHTPPSIPAKPILRATSPATRTLAGGPSSAPPQHAPPAIGTSSAPLRHHQATAASPNHPFLNPQVAPQLAVHQSARSAHAPQMAPLPVVPRMNSQLPRQGLQPQVSPGRSQGDPFFMVGLEQVVQEVFTLLACQSTGPRIVVMHGAMGLGKTAAARATFDRLRREVEGVPVHWMELVSGLPTRQLVEFQRGLVRKMVGQMVELRGLEEGRAVLEAVLTGQPLVLAVDGVTGTQLTDVLPHDIMARLHPNSVVLVTARTPEATARLALPPHASILTYAVRPLPRALATELFCRRAFGTSKPPPQYESWVPQVVALSSGLPMAIESTALAWRRGRQGTDGDPQ